MRRIYSKVETVFGDSGSGMRQSHSTCRIGTCFALAICFLLMGLRAGDASCLNLSDRAPRLELDLFAKDPTRVLNYAQSDNDKLETKITTYLASDPDLLPAVTKLITKTTYSQRMSMGIAVAKASLHCAALDPEKVQKFLKFVNSSGDSNLLAGYTSVGAESGIQLQRLDKLSQPGSLNDGLNKSSQPARPSDGLVVGEFGTDLADPFAEVPLPPK